MTNNQEEVPAVIENLNMHRAEMLAKIAERNSNLTKEEVECIRENRPVSWLP